MQMSIGSLGVHSKTWTALGVETVMRLSTACLVPTHTLFCAQSSATANASLLFAIRGAGQSGLGHGLMDQRSGRRSGCPCLISWAMRLATTANL